MSLQFFFRAGMVFLFAAASSETFLWAELPAQQVVPVDEGRVSMEVVLSELKVPEAVSEITPQGDVLIGLANGEVARLKREDLDAALRKGVVWDQFEFPEEFVKAVRTKVISEKLPSTMSCIRKLDPKSPLCDFVCHVIAICHDPLPTDPPNQKDICTEIQRGCVEKVDRMPQGSAQEACRPFCIGKQNARRFCDACNIHPKFK